MHKHIKYKMYGHLRKALSRNKQTSAHLTLPWSFLLQIKKICSRDDKPGPGFQWARGPNLPMGLFCFWFQTHIPGFQEWGFSGRHLRAARQDVSLSRITEGETASMKWNCIKVKSPFPIAKIFWGSRLFDVTSGKSNRQEVPNYHPVIWILAHQVPAFPASHQNYSPEWPWALTRC